jgi:hypothetical protein
MIGGAGDDTYIVDNAGDVVNEAAPGSDGIDTVVSSIDFSLVADASGFVENLILTDTAVTAVGNALDNEITGNSLGNKIYGLEGNDTLTGGDGNDEFIFGVESIGDTNTITDFDLFPGETDLLDLRDLMDIQGGDTETGADLNDYLHFNWDGANTIITIDVDGAAGGVSFDDATIVLQGVNVNASNTVSDIDVINQMLTQGNLDAL